jgi:hypothetical protein
MVNQKLSVPHSVSQIITESRQDSDKYIIEPHDITTSAPLEKRSYHHPDYHISFRFRGDDWLHRVSRARALR